MKNFILIILIVLLAGKISAQDTLFLHNKTIKIANVKEVNQNDVTFTQPSDIVGRVYRFAARSVDSIKYERGTTELVRRRWKNPPAGRPRAYKPELIYDPRFMNLGDKMVSSGLWFFNDGGNGSTDPNVTAWFLNLEKMILQNHLSFNVRPFVALNKKIAGTSAGATIYPLIGKRAQFITGPQFLIFSDPYIKNTYDKSGNLASTERYPSTITAFVYSLGGNIQTSQKWSVLFDLGIGQVISNSYKRSHNIGRRSDVLFGNPMFSVRAGAGYRF